MRRWQKWMGTGSALALLAGSGTAASWELSSSGQGSVLRPPPIHPRTAQLVSYESCSQMLGQMRSQALSELNDNPSDAQAALGTIEGEQLPVAGGVRRFVAVSSPAMASPAVAGSTVAGPASAPAAAPSAAGSSSTAGTPTFSTTNDQVAGVDEPDLAKTNGQVLVALRQSTDSLEVAAVSSNPGLKGTLDLSNLVQATGLFLVGNDVVVLGSAVSSGGSPPLEPVVPSAPAPGGLVSTPADPAVIPQSPGTDDTEVVVVGISDPAQPTVQRSFHIQGNEVDARLVSGEVEVVVTSTPTVPFVVPANSSPAAQTAALDANRAAVSTSGVSEWLPSVTSEPSGTTTTAGCTAAMHTTSASGSGTIGVVPIDPTSDAPGPEATVVGDASAVYASASTLYVAFSTSEPGSGPVVPSPSPAVDTTIDAFDLSDPGTPTYMGSGSVPGTLIGQYAMSEYQGDLQVATTVGTPTPAPQDGSAPATLSDNVVTVLAPQGGALVPVGSLTGLGTGENIYAVRFEGPLAFVVTFNQTDPLYVIDMSNPADPTLAGQLPLTGYSSFLEPLGDGLLLGIGQDVNTNLQTDGLQVSLFDVSNPADPTLVDKDVIPGASSTAEQDPHGLLYWAPANLVVMPVDEYPVSPSCPVCAQFPTSAPAASPAATAPFVGALGWTVNGNSLGAASEISQPSTSQGGPTGTGSTNNEPTPGPDIERALVVGDTLYTVSESGIMASNLSTLAPVSWIPYS